MDNPVCCYHLYGDSDSTNVNILEVNYACLTRQKHQCDTE